MKGDDDELVIPSCDDYMAWAAEEQDAYRQNELLRKAYEADPERSEDILRVAEKLAIRRSRRRLYGRNGST